MSSALDWALIAWKFGARMKSVKQKEFAGSPDYETKSQVAHRLNVSRRTIDNLMRQRRLPFIKLTSKIVRFPKAEVDAYLAQQFHINARGQEAR